MSQPDIFISYRRDDSAAWAARLHAELGRRFGDDRVFRDIETIEPGDRFARRIETVLDHSKVVIAVIGRRWLTTAAADGRPRLSEPDDLVRRELERALTRDDVRVIPLLVEGAELPARTALPDSLALLRDHNAVSIDDSGWDAAVDRLCRRLDPAADAARPDGAVIAGAALAAGAAAWLGSELAADVFPLATPISRAELALNEGLTFAFPAAALAIVLTLARLSRWSPLMTVAVAAGLGAVLTAVGIWVLARFRWEYSTYLLVLCALRGAVMGLCALLATRSLETALKAVAAGGVVGAVWGLVEPSVDVTPDTVRIVQRAAPLGFIGAAIGAVMTRAPRRWRVR